jgi:hypothetical protein
MALGLIHNPELVVFIAVLFITSAFAPQLSLRLKEAWLSTFTGLIGMSAIVYVLSAQGVSLDIPYSLLLFLTFISFIGYFMTSRSWGGIKINIGKNFVKCIRTIVLIVFLAGLFSWLSSAQDFSVRLVGSWDIPFSLFIVPWHLYPVLLGVTGLIFVSGLADIWQALRKHCALVLFIFMMLVALFMGRLISFVNTYLPGTIPYFERRFIPILFASISLLAPIALLKIIRVCRHSCKSKRIIYVTIISSLVILAGTTSTFLSIEHRTRDAYLEGARVTEEDWGAINYLYHLFEEKPNSRIFTITSRSMWELEFAAPRLIVGPLARPLWTAKYPEMPLWILHGAYPAYDPPYIYLHTRDTIELQDKYKGSFMNWAISIFSTVYEDSVARVIHLPTGSTPSRSSYVALILPCNYDDETGWAYFLINTLLSSGRYNYTTIYELDSRINEKEIILVPLDDSRIIKNLFQRIDKESNIRRIVVFNTGGSKYLAQHFMMGETELPVHGGYAVKLVNMQGNKELLLPTPIWVPSASLKNNTQILGWYLGEEYRAPLAARGNISGIEVTYVNIYPLAKAIKGAVEGDFNFILSQLIEVVGINLPKQKDHSPEELLNLLIFNDASFKGNITLKSDSIIFPPSQKVGYFTLHLKEKYTQICSINSIHINGIEYARIFAHRMDIDKGMGFYSSITFYNSSIHIEGVNLTVELLYENGSRKYLEGEREIMMTIPNSVNILVRTPLVEMRGKVFFKEAYGLQSVFNMLKASGQDVNVTGHVEFELLLSDEYNIARKVTIEGVVNRNPPLLQWNELESVKNSILWFIVAALIVLPLLDERNSGVHRNSRPEEVPP